MIIKFIGISGIVLLNSQTIILLFANNVMIPVSIPVVMIAGLMCYLIISVHTNNQFYNFTNTLGIVLQSMLLVKLLY